MNILSRKLIRDLWQAKGQFLSVLVIVIIGVMFYTGINAGFLNLSGASEKYYKDQRLGDLWVSFYKAPESAEQKVQVLPFVKLATGRIVQDVNIGISKQNAVVRIVTLPDVKKDIVNDILLQSGSYFSSEESNQCLVDTGFYKAHNLKTGDYIYPIINGNAVKLKVAGSVINPEYVYTVKDASELVGDSNKFGIVYVKKSFGQSVLGFDGAINSLSLTVKDGTNIDKAKSDIEKLFKEYGVIGVLDRDSQLSSKMVSEKMKSYKSLGSFFPVIFFIVAAVIIYITMGRMIENQRAQIGVLKAFGFSDFQVLLHYLSFSVLIALVGSIIGCVLGVYLGKGFSELINFYFNFPKAPVKLYPDLFIPASLLTLFFCLLAGYNACKKTFRIMPSEAMRQKMPVKGKRILIEKINFIWENLKYSWKIIFRNIFRYKRRALLTSVGVIFATALVVLAFGLNTSVNYLVNEQYTNIQNYDIKVNFTKLLGIDEMSRIGTIAHVSKLEPLVETGVQISYGWRKKDTGFTALVTNPEMYKTVDRYGNSVTLPENGILVPEKVAKALGAKVGDLVSIKSFFPRKEKKTVQIKGIIEQYLGTSVYGNLDSMNALLGEGMVANSVVLKLDSESSEKEVIDNLKDIPAISSVQSKSEAYNNLKNNLAPMTTEVGFIIVLSSILSIAVIYNIATINIFERQRELATLKVLGFKDNEVRNLIFNENYLITIFGILVGLPIGSLLGTSMMASYETDAYTIPFIVGGKAYLMAFILILVFTAMANFILMKKIGKISMVEVLKSNE